MPDSSPYRLPNEEELQQALGQSESRSLTDCPTEAALRQLVTGACAKDEPFLSAILDHLADCPDCETKLRKIRMESLDSPSLPAAVGSGQHRLLWLSACLVLLIATFVAVWFLKIHEPLPETATIDLRLVTRGVGESSPPSVTFHHREVQIQVLLPKEKAPGEYELGIFDPSNQTAPLLTQPASAVVKDDSKSIQALFRLEKLPAGAYLLGIRDGSSPWSYYPFTLK